VNVKKRRRVAVYDNSLNMAGIIASLKVDTTLEVLCVNPDSPDARQSLDKNDLMAIVFDLSDPGLKLDVAVLRGRPGLLLIGVDPSRDEVLVLSSHPKQVLSVADLVKVIRQKDSNFEVGNHEKNYQR
jgi:hypothetical protein